MRARKLGFKLYLEEGVEAPSDAVIPIFHEWIKKDALGELLIDVSDYDHVKGGPGVLLTGHYSDYTLDQTEGRPGLTYRKKRGGSDDDARVALRDALASLVRAARLLEQEPRLSARFRTDELLFRIYDRLIGPNDDETQREVEPPLLETLASTFGSDRIELVREGAARELFTLRARIHGAPSLAALAAAG
jgi:hypothetical protein